MRDYIDFSYGNFSAQPQPCIVQILALKDIKEHTVNQRGGREAVCSGGGLRLQKSGYGAA